MDLPTAQHQDMEMETQSVESMMVSQNSKGSGDNQVMRKARPQAEQALKCPRCDSTNTKFCYYNNYSLSQPRYFCKSCRRYWTQGGTLRNVPVGGGCRKNKRSSSSSTIANNNSSASANSSKKSQDHPFAAAALPHLSYDHHHTANDLTLAFARLHKNSCGTGPTFNDFDFSVLGSMPNADVFNAFAYNSSQPALYYGNDNHNHVGGIQTSGDQMRLQPYDQDQDQDHHHHHNQYSNATTTATTVTTMKQELFGGREMNYNWGSQNWQMNNSNHHNTTNATDNHSNMMMMPMDFDSTTAARTERWNSNAFNNASSWHGLLNSPLM